MNAVEFARQQLRQSREFLQGTMSDVDEKSAHALPPGKLNTVAATYAHLIVGEDGFVNGLLRGQAPLIATTWAERTGLSESPPDGTDWNAWGRRVKIDLPKLRQYADGVAAATDAWLASLSPEDLDREVDLSAMGFGKQTVGWVIGAGVIGHVQSHWGEICALKGLTGGKGFPV